MKRTRLQALALLVAAVVAAAFVAVRAPSPAYAQMGEDRPIGIKSDQERQVFSKLRCMCGGCARLPLSECTCGYAADRRDEIRAGLAGGMSIDDVMTSYVKRFGTESLEIPRNEGANRLLYLAPITLALAGAVGVGLFLRRLRRRAGPMGARPEPGAKAPARDAYDDKLDDELRRLDDDG